MVSPAAFASLLEGIQAEVMRQPTWQLRMRTAVLVLSTFSVQMVGLIGMIPYTVRAKIAYDSLPEVAVRSHHKPSVRGNPSHDLNPARFIIAVGRWLSAMRLSLIRHPLLRRALRMAVREAEDRPIEGGSVSARGSSDNYGDASSSVAVVRDLPYGPQLRNKLDIYIPSEPASPGGRSVVVFVHGGAWATGDKSYHAPMAVRIAAEGAIVVTVQYTLFPEALVPQQVSEASSALSWVMNHIHEYGGDPHCISFCGHSSGAHLCAMTVWRRFKAHCSSTLLPSLQHSGGSSSTASQGKNDSGDCGSSRVTSHSSTSTSTSTSTNCRSSTSTSTSSGSSSSSSSSMGSTTTSLEFKSSSDTRQPCQLIGLCGVYDIAAHCLHEKHRGVLPFSPMTPAMGGAAAFPSLSPSLLFGALAAVKRAMESDTCGADAVGEILLLLEKRQQGAGESVEGQLHAGEAAKHAAAQSSCQPREYASIEPLADVISEQEREGVTRALQLLMSEFDDLQLLRSMLSRLDTSGGVQEDAIPLSAIIPSYLLFSSNYDVVVPPTSTLELNAHMEALGVDGENVLYDYLDHGGFAMWDHSSNVASKKRGSVKTWKTLLDANQCNFVERLLEVVVKPGPH